MGVMSFELGQDTIQEERSIVHIPKRAKKERSVQNCAEINNDMLNWMSHLIRQAHSVSELMMPFMKPLVKRESLVLNVRNSVGHIEPEVIRHEAEA